MTGTKENDNDGNYTSRFPQGVVREARRLLNEHGWNPLPGALDANGNEC